MAAIHDGRPEHGIPRERIIGKTFTILLKIIPSISIEPLMVRMTKVHFGQTIFAVNFLEIEITKIASISQVPFSISTV